MNTVFWAGALLVGSAVLVLVFVLVGSAAPRVPRERVLGQEAAQRSVVAAAFRGFARLVDRLMRNRGWQPFRATELELADVKMPASQLVAGIVMLSGTAVALGVVVRHSILLGLALAVMIPVGVKMWLRIRAGQRRRRFNSQLETMLQMLASSLRAGQSFQQALASCARDAEAPMSDELTRVVNEHRIGRDIVEAMEDTADRMECEDFVWLAEAVETTRESGGNLNEVVDRVAQTIRDRTEIREKVHAFASEGRFSSYILMSLPVFVGVMYSFISPGYLDPLFATGVGRLMLGCSAVMYVVSYFWMRAIVQVKV